MSDIEESVKEIEGVAEDINKEQFSGADEIEALQSRNRKAKQQNPNKNTVESHAQLLQKQEDERLHEDIKQMMDKISRHHANTVIQERPGLVIKDQFGKTSDYYLNIIEYMRDAPDIFLGGDLNKQKRLLTLLTDPREQKTAMDTIKKEGLEPEKYSINE